MHLLCCRTHLNPGVNRAVHGRVAVSDASRHSNVNHVQRCVVRLRVHAWGGSGRPRMAQLARRTHTLRPEASATLAYHSLVQGKIICKLLARAPGVWHALHQPHESLTRGLWKQRQSRYAPSL